MSENSGASKSPVTGLRFQLGIVLFVLSIVLPLAGVPLVAFLGLSAGKTTTLSSVLLVGGEVMGIAAIAVMGKSGYLYLKNRLLGFLKRVGPPDEVSRGRYTLGLVMFCVPILFSWVSPYASSWIPGVTTYPLHFAIGGDLLLLTSLFVLGGDFWDKVRSLFVRDAKANFLSPISNVTTQEARV